MPNLRDIRTRISSIDNTQQITKAMKMVAAAKLRKAQNRMLENRPYSRMLKQVLARVAEAMRDEFDEDFVVPLFRQPDLVKKAVIIVVGSDRGLCGGFNTNLFKVVEKRIQEEFGDLHDSGNLELVCIGRKACQYFPKRGYNVVEEVPGFLDRLDFAESAAIMKKQADRFTSGELDAVHVAYNEFKSVISQNRVVDSVLPIQPDAFEGDEQEEQATREFIIEPSADVLFDRLLPKYLNIQLWRAVLESNASEQGARMAAMDNATENAKELQRTLKLKYNQARQSAITTEISEIVSGASALRNA
jgi:F-type H+-transporting ATPase subunit gamma